MALVPVKLRRWGNSLAAIIPADVAREEGLREGDEIVLDIDRRSAARRAFGLLRHATLDAQRMKDEDREAW
ncbi:MAG TPA: AbrB/MazE/SpoVT family DNA-binding domain-containing protein [Candidatus Thermoplasmatota archaeon]|jgi:antitoxin component of MazEF toxin-antitoxin module|nr:AbrB/MazE/SpoVT family DNA-binding domain-containing protein [Candidatus Thermoplasmatota archaeon]